MPQPVPTNGTGSAKPWRPYPPALAAGLTERVWSLRAVLMCRVPPWPQPQALEVGAEPDDRGMTWSRWVRQEAKQADTVWPPRGKTL